nr:DHA2 family efflux MFS transporter permease subunit [Pedosphaera parvula]
MDSRPKAKQFAQPLPVDPDHVPLRSWIAVIGSMLGAFMAVLDIQITNASLSDIVGGLGSSLEEGSWISTSYLVAEIIVIPLTGWLALVFSTRRYLMANSALFLFFSMCCAWAWDLPSMIIFRALQGITGGVLIPMAFNIILTKLPASKRPMGFAMFGITATFAPAIGPTIGGWLTDTYHWTAIFYMNIVPGLVLLAAIWYGVESQPMKLSMLRKGDWWGILFMALGLGSLIIVLEEGNRKDWFGSPFITRFAVIGTVSLIIFLVIEFLRKEPVINLRLLARRNFGLGSVVNVALGLGLYGASFILPVYLAQIQGYNAMQIGETIMWAGLPQLFIMPLVPLLMKKFDIRTLISAGIVMFAASCFMNAFMTHDTAVDQLKWSQMLRALGSPLIMVPLTELATGMIEKEQAGSASGLFNMMRNLGGSLGIAILSTMLTRREQFHSVRLGESVSAFDLATQQRLDQLTSAFINHGSDPTTAANQALGALNNVVHREASIMGFNDCFYIIGVALLLTLGAVWFSRKVKVSGQAMAH